MLKPFAVEFIYLATSAECAGSINWLTAVKGLMESTNCCVFHFSRVVMSEQLSRISIDFAEDYHDSWAMTKVDRYLLVCNNIFVLLVTYQVLCDIYITPPIFLQPFNPFGSYWFLSSNAPLSIHLTEIHRDKMSYHWLINLINMEVDGHWEKNETKYLFENVDICTICSSQVFLESLYVINKLFYHKHVCAQIQKFLPSWHVRKMVP